MGTRHLLPKRRAPYTLFDKDTRAIIYGMQPFIVQRMLDFDHICQRERPSVAALVAPTENQGCQRVYWGTSEVLIPIYTSVAQAVKHCPDADVLVNFSPCQAVYSSTMEALNYAPIRTIAIIAEGVPERRTRLLIQAARQRRVTIIGPATIGGIKPGCFRIGNTGGMLDNVIASRLYRPGSVAYVSRSGGFSNELNNIISRNSDGVYEGIAIGGDRYPGSTFLEHLLRYQADPAVKLMVLLGEVGGRDEYDVCAALRAGRITKPLVAWCMGTCAKVFSTEVQLGHAGALARGESETSDAKNAALRNAGALVPANFADFGHFIYRTYESLVAQGVIIEQPEPEPPQTPMDYAWAQKMGLMHKPCNIVSTITDDRGAELVYAGMPIAQVFEEQIGVGGVVSLLWFKRTLPRYALTFIEMILIAIANRDLPEAGMQNITTATAAGKDLVSALVSGLLTIGPRSGGAVESAARDFAVAYDAGLSPQAFVQQTIQRGQRIQGIGYPKAAGQTAMQHVAILKKYAQRHFPPTDLLDYALEVEHLLTSQHSHLHLNIDGCIGVLFTDLLRSCGAFTTEEADEYIQMGSLTGLFVLGRTLAFIAHSIAIQRHSATTSPTTRGHNAVPPMAHTLFAQDMGIGGLLGLLWFQRPLPAYARTFIEMVLMLTADNGPAVSGAHNTIIAARADKDLVASIASGLLTLGPRFGGAIDGAARIFTCAYAAGLSPQELIDDMKQRGEVIMGIGHRCKSAQHPDIRITMLKAFARQHFPNTALLDYALAVEQLTIQKRSNLILNIDGCIATCFVDLLHSCGAFTRQEADEYVRAGFLNGLFMLGRTIGLIGHYLDQKRLKQGLYRHPWDDIAYMLPDEVLRFDE